MKLEGTYEFEAPREVIGSIIPGAGKPEEIGENHYQMVLEVKVGPISGRFESTIQLTDLHPPENYHMIVTGKGPIGHMDGNGEVRLEAQDGKTIMHYTGDAQVGGKVAAVGQRLLDMTAKAITKQSLNALAKRIRQKIEEGS
jgi:uncharacterized protein